MMTTTADDDNDSTISSSIVNQQQQDLQQRTDRGIYGGSDGNYAGGNAGNLFNFSMHDVLR